MYRTMNTGPFQDVQADVLGDLSTFKLDGVGVDLSNAFFILVRVRLKLLCLLYYCACTMN